MKRVARSGVVCLVVAFLCSLPHQAEANLLTAEDGNSALTVDPHTQAGLADWIVDGVDHLNQAWVWGRLDPLEPEGSLDQLPLVTEELLNLDFDSDFETVHLVYNGTTLQEPTPLEIELFLTLVGGAPGSGSSAIEIQASATNVGTTTLFDPQGFFFVNLDLNGTAVDDSASFDGSTTFTQTQGGTSAAVSVSGAPDFWQLDGASSLLASLNDALPTTLSDGTSPFGLGDVAFAYQFFDDIGAGERSEGTAALHLLGGRTDITTPVVPEPSSLFLIGMGFVGVMKCRRRVSAP